jgi:hypothetical protein
LVEPLERSRRRLFVSIVVSRRHETLINQFTSIDNSPKPFNVIENAPQDHRFSESFTQIMKVCDHDKLVLRATQRNIKKLRSDISQGAWTEERSDGVWSALGEIEDHTSALTPLKTVGSSNGNVLQARLSKEILNQRDLRPIRRDNAEISRMLHHPGVTKRSDDLSND